MDRILIVLKKENGPRASSAPALGLNTIIFKYVYWHMKQISGERLQDHWSSGFFLPDFLLTAHLTPNRKRLHRGWPSSYNRDNGALCRKAFITFEAGMWLHLSK